jgi:Icc-related predicted phosphoesterase
MKILVLSDLHLSHHTFRSEIEGNRIDGQADVVVLAGDIDDGLGGIRWARETFPDKPIVLVAGNHEFYDRHWFRQVDDMRDVANKFDVDFLEADEIDILGVRFLGCSLWTDFELFGTDKKEVAMSVAKAQMIDYECIKVPHYAEFHWAHSKNLTPELTVLRHQGSVDWLTQELEKGNDPKKTVVVTHHAPHPNSVPMRFQKDMLSAAYSSDLSRLMGKSGLWIHGHMHHSVDYSVNGTRIVANPRGCLHKNGGFENSDFNPALIVEV